MEGTQHAVRCAEVLSLSLTRPEEVHSRLTEVHGLQLHAILYQNPAAADGEVQAGLDNAYQ